MTAKVYGFQGDGELPEFSVPPEYIPLILDQFKPTERWDHNPPDWDTIALFTILCKDGRKVNVRVLWPDYGPLTFFVNDVLCVHAEYVVLATYGETHLMSRGSVPHWILYIELKEMYKRRFLTPTTDEDLLELKENHEDRRLDLSFTEITDAGIAHLAELPNLGELFLGYTQITDAGLVHLAKLVNLRTLILQHTMITDRGLIHLKGLTKLEDLDLSYTDVAGPGLAHLRELPSLGSLSLDGTKMTMADLTLLKGIGKLRVVYLHRTRFTENDVPDLRKALPGILMGVDKRVNSIDVLQ